jgi:hypothetical protein
MHGGRYAAQLVQAARGYKKAQRELALSFLIERTDHLSEVIDLCVSGACASASLKRGRVVPTHHPRQNAYFEEGDELFLRVDFTACCCG